MSAAVDIAARVTLLLTCGWLAALLLRRAAAATRHLAWTLAVVGALLLPVCSAILPEWRILPEAGSAKALRSIQALDPGRWALGASGSGPSAHSPESPEPKAQSPFVAQRVSAANAARAMLAIWAVVTLALLARIGLGIAAVRRLAREARPADARWRALLCSTIDAAGVGRPVRLLVSGSIGMPMAWGDRRPVVLLPLEALEWSDDRARVVLLHELAHIRRRDAATHALGRTLVALHWFNPLAWIALGAMTRERERACDDFVLAHGARPSDYAQHLLEIAREGISAASYAMAPAMARKSELEGRLLSILTQRRRQSGRITTHALAGSAVVLTVAVAAATPYESRAEKPSATLTRTPARPTWIFQNEPSQEERQETRQEREHRKTLTQIAVADPDEDAREEATMALALRSEPDVVEALLRALKDDSSQVREKAALGLAMRRDPRVVEALLEAAADPDPQVREKVMIALSLSGDERAIAALTKALDDPDSQVREKAVGGLALSPAGEALRDGIAGALSSFTGNRRR